MQMKIQKKINKFISALLLAIICVSTIFVNSMEVYAYGNAKQGVVVVTWYLKGVKKIAVEGNKIKYVVDECSDFNRSRGTGFFVGNNDENPSYVATNFHVINGFVDNDMGNSGFESIGKKTSEGYDLYYQFESSELRVYYSETDYDVVSVIDYGKTGSGNVDLAILKLDEPTDKRQALPLLVPTEEMVGKEVYAVGFPALSDNNISDASKWGINDITITKGVINRLVAASGTGLESIQTDAVISGGNSGGPLVDMEGNVIGINTWGKSENITEFYYAINVSELISMLNRKNISYEMVNAEVGADANESEKEDNTTIIVIACVSAAILVVVVVIIVFLSKNKKKDSTGTASTTNKQSQANSSNSSVKRTPMLRSLASQHKGACYAVGNTTLFIGRDASVCKITFKEGSVGVSGKHCSIMYKEDTNEFVLTDLGSSYGTFLANGQRLQPNIAYRIKSGETFYVGDKTNMLLVEVK